MNSKKHHTHQIPLVFALTVILFALLSVAGTAQTIWDGGGSDNKWETPENWNNNIAPTSGDTTAVQLAGTVNTSIDIGSSFTFQKLTVNSGAGPFSLSGSLLVLNGTSPDGGTTILNSSSSLLTINNDLKLTGGSGIYSNGGGSGITLKGNIDLNGQNIRFLTGGANRTITIDGVISGTSGSFAYNGYNSAGTFYVNAANTYTAATNIWHGTVVANNGGAFGTGTVTLGPTTNNTGTFNATLLTGSAVTVTNTLRLGTNANAAVTINHTLGGQHTTGTSVFSGDVTLGTDSRAAEDLTVTAAAGGRVDFAGNLLRATGATGTTDTVTKTGAGIVTLSGVGNTYSGTTTVSAGTLLVNGVLASGGAAVTVNSGATLGGYGAINRDVVLSSGSFLEVGDNDAALTGTLTLGGDLSLGDGVTVKFDLGSNSAASDSIVVTGSVTLGDSITFDLSALSGLSSPSYTLLSAAGGIVGAESIIFTGYDFSADYQLIVDANSISLVSSAIPEPGSIALFLGGGLLAWTLACRRRHE